MALLAPAGCAGGNGAANPAAGENNAAPGNDPAPGDRARVQIYLAGLDAATTGVRNPATGYTIAVTRSIPAGDTIEVLQKAMLELIRGPGPEDNDAGPAMPDTTRILNVFVRDGIARIDLSRETLVDSTGGTLGGTIFMEAVVLTATQFSSIDRVQVLVEGEPWCDGHFFWEEPLGREDILP